MTGMAGRLSPIVPLFLTSSTKASADSSLVSPRFKISIRNIFKISFLTASVLIILFGGLYFVLPKYEVKNVKYESLTVIASENSNRSKVEKSESQVLVRINKITGKTEELSVFSSWIDGELRDDARWQPIERTTKNKKS